jgi:hypothetical protein
MYQTTKFPKNPPPFKPTLHWNRFLGITCIVFDAVWNTVEIYSYMESELETLVAGSYCLLGCYSL